MKSLFVRSVVSLLGLLPTKGLTAALLLVLGASAQGWVDVTPAQPGLPGYVGTTAMCYDPVRMVSWLFSANPGSITCNSWDGTAWAAHVAAPAGGNSLQWAVWDSSASRVVVAVTPPSGGGPFSFATWDGTSWGALPNVAGSSQGYPPFSVVVYDAARSELLYVLRTLSGYSEHWVYSGGAWTLKTPLLSLPAPPVGSDVSCFYDHTMQRPVVVANFAYTVQVPGYFEWNGNNWVQRYPNPIYSDLGQVASAPSRGISLAQTFWPLSTHPRTFAIANGSFSELFLTNWPAARNRAHVVYDSHRDVFVLHGGTSSSGSFRDTWELAMGPTASFTTMGSGCPGSGGTPTLAPQSGTLPRVNTQFTVQVSGLPWTGPAFMWVGFSDQFYGTVPLPANLAILGAPQCNLYISGDLLYGMPNVLGLSTWTLAIPNTPGFTFFNQAIVFDPPANALGLTLSNAGRAIVGQ